MTTPLVQVLTMLAELYPHPPMTGPRLAAYRHALADLTDAECAVAYHALSREAERKFYPAPGEILAAARPKPTAGVVAELYDAIEYAVLLKRATLATIEGDYGIAARLAVQAAGGLEAIRRTDGRVFTLKAFTEAFQEADTAERVSPRQALGPIDGRLAQLVGQTVKRIGAG